MNSIKSKIKIAIIGSWITLGFKRGINSYDYFNSKNKVPLYLDRFIWGIGGVFCYVNPIFVPRNLYKEMYRLEVNIRGIEDEKNTYYYNSVI